jgi:hypothetical protein
VKRAGIRGRHEQGASAHLSTAPDGANVLAPFGAADKEPPEQLTPLLKFPFTARHSPSVESMQLVALIRHAPVGLSSPQPLAASVAAHATAIRSIDLLVVVGLMRIIHLRAPIGEAISAPKLSASLPKAQAAASASALSTALAEGVRSCVSTRQLALFFHTVLLSNTR